MPSYFRLSRLVAPLLAFGTFISCQTSDPDPAPQAPEVSATFRYPESWKRPDSLTWAVGSGAHKAVDRQSIDSSKAVAKFTAHFGTADTVKVGAWVAGMRFAVGLFRWDGKSSELDGIGLVNDPVAIALLDESSDSAMRRRDTIQKRYARHLVEGDSAFKGFPGNCPTGIDTAAVISEALVYALSKKIPYTQLAAKWSLSLDSASLVGRVQSLISSGKADDSALIRAFPPYPVRMGKALSVADLEPGKTVSVKGIFVGDSGLVSLGWKVVQGGVDRSFGFRLSFSAQVAAGAKTWDLQTDADATLEASTAALGSYRLVVWMADRNGRADTASVEFQFTTTPARTAPVVRILSPAPDSILANKDSTVLVKALVVGGSRVDSVRIGGAKATRTSDTAWREVPVPATGASFAIHVVAYDSLGNLTDSVVRVARKLPSGDIGSPSLSRLYPVAQTGNVLGGSDSTLYVKFVATSPSGISDTGVRIDGVLARRLSDSLWSREVPVPATGLDYTILVELVDRRGRKTVEWVKASRTRNVPTASLRRAMDSTKGDPPLRSGSHATTTDSVTLKWNVVGSCQGCAYRIDDRSVESVDGLISARLAVSEGIGKHVAAIRFGDSSLVEDTVSVHRYPKLAFRRLLPASDTLGSNDTAVEVVWEVLHARSVRIDGIETAIAATSLYRTKIAVSTSGSPNARISATDSIGTVDSANATFFKAPRVDLAVIRILPDSLSWDSTVFRISSLTSSPDIFWSLDSQSWTRAGDDGLLVLRDAGRLFVRATKSGYLGSSYASPAFMVHHTNRAPSFLPRLPDTLSILEDSPLDRFLYADSLSKGAPGDSTPEHRRHVRHASLHRPVHRNSPFRPQEGLVRIGQDPDRPQGRWRHVARRHRHQHRGHVDNRCQAGQRSSQDPDPGQDRGFHRRKGLLGRIEIGRSRRGEPGHQLPDRTQERLVQNLFRDPAVGPHRRDGIQHPRVHPRRVRCGCRHVPPGRPGQRGNRKRRRRHLRNRVRDRHVRHLGRRERCGLPLPEDGHLPLDAFRPLGSLHGLHHSGHGILRPRHRRNLSNRLAHPRFQRLEIASFLGFGRHHRFHRSLPSEERHGMVLHQSPERDDRQRGRQFHRVRTGRQRNVQRHLLQDSGWGLLDLHPVLPFGVFPRIGGDRPHPGFEVGSDETARDPLHPLMPVRNRDRAGQKLSVPDSRRC